MEVPVRALAVVLLTLLPAVASAKPGELQLRWRFANVEKGYDHLSRMEVSVDGAQVAQSTPAPETKPGKLTFTKPSRGATLRVVNFAYYEGTWEEHTVANEYSVDCVWEIPVASLAATRRIDLLCDLDEGASMTRK